MNIRLFYLFALVFFIFSCTTPQETTSTTTTSTSTTTTLIQTYQWLKADSTNISLATPQERNNGASDWRDEVIYFIVADRFYDGDSTNNIPAGCNPATYNKSGRESFQGGDLKGILDNADYIKKLGVTSVWITPIVKNVWECGGDGRYTGYHGYIAQDMSVVDPHFAKDNDDYKNFVSDMHKKGLLVIQDVVVNHMGDLLKYTTGEYDGWAPIFKYPDGYTRIFIEEQYPPATNSWVATGNRIKAPVPFDKITAYHNFGNVKNYDDPIEGVLGDLDGNDDLKTEDPEIRTALINIYKKWIADANVDGFRIDTVKHVEEGFWDEFNPAMRTVNPTKKFFQFGEVFTGEHFKTAKYAINNRLDSLLNFELYSRIKDVIINGMATNLLTKELDNRKQTHRNTPINNGGGEISAIDGAVNFIDNHDVTRFLSESGTSLEKMYLSLGYLMTTKGIPCIYYRTEQDTTGVTGIDGRIQLTDFDTTNKKTFTLIRILSKIRKDNVSLRRGDIAVLKDSTTKGIFSFVRYDGNDTENVIVVMNTSPVSINENITTTNYFTNGDTLENILYKEFNQTDNVTIANNSLTTTIEPYGIKIFKKVK